MHADREADDEVVAGARADPADDLAGEAHAVLERAAPAVVAAVRPGRPELVDQRVVGGEQLDAVEAGLPGAPGGRREGFDHLEDLGLAHRVAAVGIVVGRQARGRPVGPEGVVVIAVLADVVELVDHHRAVRLAGRGDAAERRDHGIVRVAEVAAGQDRRRVHRHRLDHDHRRPAPRPLLVIAAVTLAGQAAFGHVGGVRAEHEAALQRLVAQRERREEVGKRAHQAQPPASSRWTRNSALNRSRWLPPPFL